MNNNIKKISIIVCFALVFIFVPKLTLHASDDPETLGELENEITKMQEEYNNKQAELDDKQLQYDQLLDELSQVVEQQKEIENNITDLENQVTEKESEIDKIESEIPESEYRAEISLKILQKNANSNLVLEAVYNTVLKNQNSVIETLSSTNKIFTALNASLYNLLEMLSTLEIETQQLKETKDSLEYKKQELEIQEDYLNNLQDELDKMIASLETDISESKDIIEANKNLEKLAEDAGCGPNDVIGIDCAKGDVVSDTGFYRPLPHGVISNEFGVVPGMGYFQDRHSGIDIAGNNTGTPIYPVANGKVLYAGATSDGGGNSVILLHTVNGKNYISRYCHMDSVNVSTGDNVSRTTTLGGVGNSGYSYGAHLHLEMQEGASYNWYATQNPRDFINFPPIGVWW